MTGYWDWDPPRIFFGWLQLVGLALRKLEGLKFSNYVARSRSRPRTGVSVPILQALVVTVRRRTTHGKCVACVCENNEQQQQLFPLFWFGLVRFNIDR